MHTICLPLTIKYESMHRNVALGHSIYSVIFSNNGIVGTFWVHQTWNLPRNHQMGILDQKCSSYTHNIYVDRNHCKRSIGI